MKRDNRPVEIEKPRETEKDSSRLNNPLLKSREFARVIILQHHAVSCW